MCQVPPINKLTSHILRLLCNEYCVSFPWVKMLGCDVDHLPPSRAQVRERVELYTFFPFCGSWPVIGRPLPLHFIVYPLPGQNTRARLGTYFPIVQTSTLP